MQHQDVYFKSFAKNGTSSKTADDLDIVNLIERAIGFMNAFKLVLMGFAAAGLAFGLYWFLSSPKQSSSKLMLHSNLLTNQEGIEIIDDWNSLLAKNQFSTLALIMNCGETTLKKLSHISAEEVQKVYVQNNPNGFVINVVVTDTSVLNQLEVGIVYGLNTTPFVREKLLARTVKYKQLISNTKTEIEKLDLTKTAIENMIAGKNANSASLVVDVSRLNSSWIELNEKLLAYQEELKFLTGVYVLEDFNKGKMGRSLIKPLLLGLLAGCFLGYIASLFLYIRQKIKAARVGYIHQ